MHARWRPSSGLSGRAAPRTPDVLRAAARCEFTLRIRMHTNTGTNTSTGPHARFGSQDSGPQDPAWPSRNIALTVGVPQRVHLVTRSGCTRARKRAALRVRAPSVHTRLHARVHRRHIALCIRCRYLYHLYHNYELIDVHVHIQGRGCEPESAQEARAREPESAVQPQPQWPQAPRRVALACGQFSLRRCVICLAQPLAKFLPCYP